MTKDDQVIKKGVIEAIIRDMIFQNIPFDDRSNLTIIEQCKQYNLFAVLIEVINYNIFKNVKMTNEFIEEVSKYLLNINSI